MSRVAKDVEDPGGYAQLFIVPEREGLAILSETQGSQLKMPGHKCHDDLHSWRESRWGKNSTPEGDVMWQREGRSEEWEMVTNEP